LAGVFDKHSFLAKLFRMNKETIDWQYIQESLLALGDAIRNHLHQFAKKQSIEQLSSVAFTAKEDVIYAIDREVEPLISAHLRTLAIRAGGIVLIAEGVAPENSFFPAFSDQMQEEARVRIIMDPIDGTRMIMYAKRSAFFLAGAALNFGFGTRLLDIEIAVLCELPTQKAAYADDLWARKGAGTQGQRRLLRQYRSDKGNDIESLKIAGSRAKTLINGFGQVARIISPGRDILAQVDEYLVSKLYGDTLGDKPLIFEDQYISTGGQIYEVMMGHDRFCADLRPWLNSILQGLGRPLCFTCHPYDCSAMLLATEAGCKLYDWKGEPFDGPMDLLSDMGWMLFANQDIDDLVRPILLEAMQEIKNRLLS
jgi:hypothetical protein